MGATQALPLDDSRLGRLSGKTDVVIGSPTANRSHVQLEGLIGFLVNNLVVRIDMSGSPTGERLLERVKVRTLRSQANQDIPFEQVVELVQPARSASHSPVFLAMSRGRTQLERRWNFWIASDAIATRQCPGRHGIGCSGGKVGPDPDLTLGLREQGGK